MPHATSPFVVDELARRPPFAEAEGLVYERIELHKTFRGELDAHSHVEMLSVTGAAEGAGYVALERVEGTLQGRSGSFALLQIGTMVGDRPWVKVPIAPGSGTGELRGISGEATIEVDPAGAHTLQLEYQIG
ncbi:MAG: DUF3224 domain-containing protein [Candidatus Dormibacteria bacterium]